MSPEEERETEAKIQERKDEEEKQKSMQLAASTMYWKYPEDLSRFDLIAIAFYKGIYVCGQSNKSIKSAGKLELLTVIAKADLSILANKTRKHFFKSEVNTIKWVPIFPQEENPFIIQKQARENLKIDIDSFMAKIKSWEEELEKIRMASANVDVTDAGADDEEDEAFELDNTANPFIITAAEETIKPMQLNLESDQDSTKFPEKAFSTDSLTSDTKNDDHFQTPIASSRYVPKTSTPGVHFAQESERIPPSAARQTSSIEDPVIQQLLEKISRLEQSHAEAPKSTKTNSLTYKLKLVYDPKTPIEDFLTSVENYGRANSVYDTQKFISVAQAAMSATSEGMQLQSSIETEDLSSWENSKPDARKSPDIPKSIMKISLLTSG
ncbi:unnamed protein product [Oikopleura dioica]|uniref:Uncharacterized protein n=1 Tax=Oikopleura dioica TaxID=34765 RepID=E4XLD1_OIKDI|nr:unnamed protein product [Oikopleura dioica]